jgi:Alb1
VKSGGITKKRPRTKRQTRQQRVRQEKGLMRAGDVLDKLERKMEGSLKKVKIGRDRRRCWEEVNGSKKKDVGTVESEDGREGDGMQVEEEWEDEVDEEDEEGRVHDVESEIMTVEAEKEGIEDEEDKIT